MRHYAYSFILYLVITVLVENAVVFLLLKRVFKIGKEILSNKTIFLVAAFASSLTLPYVWFVFPYVFSNFFVAILISEALVFIVEAIFYKAFLRLSFPRVFFLSLVANLASFGLGELLHGWLAVS